MNRLVIDQLSQRPDNRNPSKPGYYAPESNSHARQTQKEKSVSKPR